MSEEQRIWEIVTPIAYERMAQKFLRKHPELVDAYVELLTRLRENPWDPRLDTHPLRGALRGRWGVSLTHKYRVVVAIIVTEHEILMLGIGMHDEVYR